MEDEIGKAKATIEQLEQKLASDEGLDTEERKLIRNQIITKETRLNALRAQQGKCISDFFFLFFQPPTNLFVLQTLHPNHISISNYHSELLFRACSWSR